MTTQQLYNTTYDLTNCDAEPLRFIRSCQDLAVMIVVYADTLLIKAVSENAAERFSTPVAELLGADAGAVLGEEAGNTLRSLASAADLSAANPVELLTDGPAGYLRENLIVHREGELLILEIEPRSKDFGSTASLMRIDKAVGNIQNSVATKENVFDITVREVRAITGYDRVYLYRFDDEYNGQVIAETKRDEMQTFLHLRYPHTDIPQQARELYLSQQIRQVTSTRENSASLLITDDDQPINLRQASNRGVSPIHQEYLRAMGVGASMSIAVVVENRLWGLIACHHNADRLVDYRMRQLLGFFGRVLSGHLTLQQNTVHQTNVLANSLIRARLVEKMGATTNLMTPLLENQDELMNLAGATGAALIIDGKIKRIGLCPEESELAQLVTFITDKQKKLYATSRLHDEFPAAKQFTAAPAGMVSIRTATSPEEYIFWFRPEIVTTLSWGGRPEDRKVIEEGRVRLSPLLSFENYSETKRGKAEPWAQYQLDGVLALGNDIREIILVQYQNMKQVNDQLVSAYAELESFSYTVSHDLRAPLRTIKGFAEILTEDYADKLDEAGQQVLGFIITHVDKMHDLLNGILEFSRMGSSMIKPENVKIAALVKNVWADVGGPESDVTLRTNFSTPTLPGDYTLLWQLFLNLLTNAVKYRRTDIDSFVEISSHLVGEEVIITVEDNGIGFDMKYAGQIFAVFNRLVPEDEYEGTGVGLAIAHRIVERHHGQISVTSELGSGTTFTVSIPANLTQRLAKQKAPAFE
ncbi:ATP-binding protein [Neolewinella antarctica]|uniref:histidine kinase n=1 Tax=Neolewinella antarctica TaxID=442734 RepID=A0ABX0XEU1_9BACT|nr:ATP-binding protein [Neolewinella antarctica]NJC27825.1 light-regulated signal transduction histidine kinase (bacteriophytochrome) [Neolewinella antarctica]